MTTPVNLASRGLGAAVLAANDEFFVAKENLIHDGPARHDGGSGPRGALYDGWETRRRRDGGTDWVIVRLAVPGIISAVVVDTAYFTGNYPAAVSVDAGTFDPGEPWDTEQGWREIVDRSPCQGDTANQYTVSDDTIATHVRLRIHPDGGVARLRVLGDVVLDPRSVSEYFDSAALLSGATVTEVSDGFYSPPDNTLRPGLAGATKDGWETRRRRDDGHDWMVIKLGAACHPVLAEIDTTHFIGNAPDACSLEIADRDPRTDGDWTTVLPRTPLEGDRRQRFVLPSGTHARYLRVHIHPDGGLARLRLESWLSPSGRADLLIRWLRHCPEPFLRAWCAAKGVSAEGTERLTAVRRDLSVVATDVAGVWAAAGLDPADAGLLEDLVFPTLAHRSAISPASSSRR
ncbi:allantoicase [Nonomuraea sp. CA-143628]|uniref:allantoicase n=1 Tax=Nonomuraea sp. CA-143628 TaxID=3239997 RepID=UPI003D89D08E